MDRHWYFDFISPFAYLQLPRVRALAERHGIEVRPIVFGAVLGHHGQLGPAEIPGKRRFTYQFVQWQAERMGMPLRFPPTHPFNSLASLRLALAAGSGWEAVSAIFTHLWAEGQAGDTPAALVGLAARLGIANVEEALAAADVKQQLRNHTDAAISNGVFGVPSLWLDGMLFWGQDATDMAEAHLADPQRFQRGEYARLADLPVGVQRAR